MRKRYRRFRVKYQGETDIIADTQEDAVEKMNRILDRISDVYEVCNDENEIYDIESEGL